MFRVSPVFALVAIGFCVLPSCHGGTAVMTALPDPTVDDRPAGSPPELPRLSVELPNRALTAPTTILAEGDDLQRALDRARPGDVIALQPGAVFKGQFTLPAKTGSEWITIRTNASALPPAGTRVNPSHAPLMPVIESDDEVAIASEPGAHHYRFVGIEVRPKPGVFVYNLILLGNEAKSVDVLPHHIVIDRCYVHGDPNVGGRRGVALNARHAAVIDSYVSDFKEKGSDSQAISAWNGTGPFLIANNYLEGAGENVMFGGGDPDIENLVQSDIEIRGNHFVKPLSWRGTWTIKNLFELKNARRVLVDSNIFENNWVDAQNGFAILFTPRNQDGGSPWSMVRDVTFSRNILRHTGSGMNILGTDDIHPSQQTKRIAIRDNVFEDVDGERWGGAGRLFQLLDGPSDVVIEHNTGFQTGDILAGEGNPTSGLIYRNNLTPHNQYGVGGSDTYGNPPLAFSTYFPGAVFVKDVLIGGAAHSYPPDNFFPASVADVRFVNFAAGDYRLANDSPYKHAATDGKDIGAAIGAASDAPVRRRAVGSH